MSSGLKNSRKGSILESKRCKRNKSLSFKLSEFVLKAFLMKKLNRETENSRCTFVTIQFA